MSNLDELGYKDATCVVTGGLSGMGEQVARILGELGAKVHIVDIQPPNGAVTGSFLYTDQGFASGVFTGAIDASFMMGGGGQ